MKTLTCEVVEYYPYEKKPFIGMMHIYIVEYEMNIRGVKVFKRGAKLYFNLPYSLGVDPETKEKVSFPIVCFSNPETFSALKNEISNKGIEFMEKNYPEIVKKQTPKVELKEPENNKEIYEKVSLN